MKDLGINNKVIVSRDDDGMRLDNYLIKIIKGNIAIVKKYL